MNGFLEDPVMEVHTEVHDVDSIVATDDWWSDGPNADQAATAAPGAFDLTPGSRDAALLLTLRAGAYTVVLRGSEGGTGEGLIEVCEVPE